MPGPAVLSHHGSLSILLYFLSRAGDEATVCHGSASLIALFPLAFDCRGVYHEMVSGTTGPVPSLLTIDTAVSSLVLMGEWGV